MSIDTLMAHGLAAHRSGDLVTAERCYRQALQQYVDDPRLLEMLAVLLDQTGRHEEALGYLTRVVERHPDQSMSHARLGGVLEALGRTDEAIAAYRRALALMTMDHPVRETLLNQLGQACHRMGRMREALEVYRELEALRPDAAEVPFNVGNILRRLGRMREAVEHYRRALSMRPDWLEAHEALLFTLAYFVLASPAETLAAHEAWAACLPVSRVYRHGSRAPRQRLRIGYVSNTFRRHAANYFFASTFASHDHDAFEVFCYAHVEQPDAVTERFARHADGWRFINGLDDEAVAEQIVEDGIDILIDLDGHTAGNRLAVFARRPAPIQLSYLGYCTTTGLATMDYWLTDAVLTPEDTVERTTERIWRLPRCWISYMPPAGAPAVRIPQGKDGVTFGSLNELSKYRPAVYDAWARILEDTPGSRLLLKTERLAFDEAREDVIAAFEQRGIPATRLDLRPRSEDYLPTYHEVDIALDPFPRTGGVTTADALWMGVPVVTLAGQRMIERQGASLLAAVGLEELVATSVDDYVARAVSLACDDDGRRQLRVGMRARLESSPLLSARDMARHLEDCYRRVWQNLEAKEA